MEALSGDRELIDDDRSSDAPCNGADGCSSAAAFDHRVLTSAADRLDELADMAELMGDEDGAQRLRAGATNRRLEAIELLDATDPGGADQRARRGTGRS